MADDALTDAAVGQKPSIVIVVNDPPLPPGPCPVTRGPHRWAWLTRGGQACGYCEARRG